MTGTRRGKPHSPGSLQPLASDGAFSVPTEGRKTSPQSSGATSVHGCCVQCGRTETPQWREGPQGPKTLCNACGVKHLRAMKKAQSPPQVGVQEHPGQGVQRKLRTKRRRSAKAEEDMQMSTASEDDDREAAQQLLDFASLAANSASEDGEAAGEEEQQVPVARRGTRKRQRSSRLMDMAEEEEADYASVPAGSQPMTMTARRPTVTAARLLAARPSGDMMEQMQHQAPAAAIVHVQPVASQESADNTPHDSECDELMQLGASQLILNQLPLTSLSAVEQLQLRQLQQAVAEAQAHARRTEEERKETLMQLVEKQAEAQLARLRLQQEARRLQNELQSACMWLNTAGARVRPASGLVPVHAVLPAGAARAPGATCM